MAQNAILLTRLMPPRLPPGCLGRDQLVERVVRGLDRRMVTVLAGAGYGKSTLLAQALSRCRSPWVWCSCDERIAHPALFLTHVAAGFGQRFPGFEAPPGQGSPEDLVTALCNECVRVVDEDVILVLDDVHTMQGPAGETVGLLVRDLPPTIHLALAGRASLTFSLGRMRAAGIVELRTPDLALSLEESREFARSTGSTLSPEAVADVHRETEGWITGLLLAGQAGDAGMRGLARWDGQLFDYLAEEVLQAQSEDLQDFLLDTSVLERFTPELASAVAGRPSADICRDLVARHLLAVRLDTEGEWYRYHQLFQASLRQRLARGDSGRLAELHRRAGRAWLAAGEPVEGIHHLLAGGDLAEAAAALEPLAEEMAHTAEAETLAGWLEQLPAAAREGRPGLVLAEASLLFGREAYEASSACIERALGQLLDAGEQARAGLAFLRVLQVALAAGTPERGPGLGERWLARLSPGAVLPATRIALRSCYAWAVLRLPADIQQFLLATAVLDGFSAEMARQVSEREDAARVMADLAALSLFTVVPEAGGERYRHHGLFRAFLRGRLAREDPARLAALHRRAASAWMAGGDPAAAVPHLLQAGEPELAADALEPLAEEMAATSEAETLVGWLEAIPEELRWRRPGLVLAEASLLFDRGACEASFGRIERAIEGLVVAGRAPEAGLVLSEILLRAMASGVGAARCAAYGAELTAHPSMPPDSRSVVRLLVAIGCALCGRLEDAGEELRAAAHGASPTVAGAARALGGVLDGVIAGHAEAALRALDDLGTEAAREIPFLGAYARLTRIRLLNNLGRHEEALAAVMGASEPAPRRHGAIREMLRWERARALAGLERWDELEAVLIEPARAEVADGGPSSQRLRASAALLAAARGDPQAVAMHVMAARVDLAGHDVVLLQPEVLCDLALAAWRAGLADQARQLAEEARDRSRALGLTWPEARAGLLGAAILGSGEGGDELLADALALTTRHGHEDLWTSRERPRAARLLVRALERSLGPPGVAAALVAACGGEVLSECRVLLTRAPAAVRLQLAEAAGNAPGVDSELLAQLGEDGDADVRRAAARSRARVGSRPRPPLRFVGLGGFAVWRGDEVVTNSAFGRQRARALLAAFLCAGRPVHREELLEWFWSGLDAERGLRALHVTLYGLRRALEPQLPRGATSSVIVAEGEGYRLRPTEEDSWDAGTFLQLAQAAARMEQGPKRLEALRIAEAAHTGPLFPEWPYERWAEQRQREVAATLCGTLGRLAEDLVDAGAMRDAIARYEHLTALEPERESWHRALMLTYERSGERALALRQYHTCRKILRDELGVETSAETRELHTAILNGRGASRASHPGAAPPGRD